MIDVKLKHKLLESITQLILLLFYKDTKAFRAFLRDQTFFMEGF